jgi:hypothetical protein
MSRAHARPLPRAALLLALCLCALATARAQTRAAGDDHASIDHGSLEEIRDKRAMMLIVGRSFAVDARTPAEVSAEDVRTALETTRVRKTLSAYRLIANKLNKYIRKYRSMTSVETRGDADFLVVFKIMQEHRSLIDGQPFTYGKLFVVVAGGDGKWSRPRLIWQSKGEMSLAEDAAGALVKALKAMRGEK